MSYQHLTTFERGRIEALFQLGYTVRQIGTQIKRHHSTIARNNKNDYCSERAQTEYIKRRQLSKYKGDFSSELVMLIEQGLKATWSPEQIAKDKVCFKTIYRWLYSGLIYNGNMNVLRHKGKRQKPSEKRGKFAVGNSIHDRPKEVKTRETFGHWELDTVVSSRGKSKGCFATFVERKTRLYTAIKIPDRTATSMDMAIKQIHFILPAKAFKTATVDRGKEFACYANIEHDLKLPIYFADPYSSWQRGSNENSNGLLREFYPKRIDLALADEKELTNNLLLINNRPRKCLGWKSPIQMFLHELSHLT